MSEAQHFTPGDHAPPNRRFKVLDGDKQDPVGIFFNQESVTKIRSRLDMRKLYGVGTVVEPTTASRLRHLRDVAGLQRDIDDHNDLIRRYQKLIKQPYASSVNPSDVAAALQYAELTEEYRTAHLVTAALLQTDSLQENKLGSKTLGEMNALLTYSIDPKTFEECHRLFLDELQNK